MGEDRRRLLEEMFRSSPDALIVVGPDGVIEVAGPATATIFGYEPEEIEGQLVEVLLPDSVRVLHRVYRATFSAAPEGRAMGVGRELYGRHRDGSVFPVDVSLAPTVIDGRPWFGAFVRDATERRRGEDALRFVNDISRGVIAGEPTPELLLRTARGARVLVGAATAWISVRVGDDMVVAAVDGDAADLLEGATVPVRNSLAARAMLTQETVIVADMRSEPEVMKDARTAGFGPGLYLPMEAEDGPLGSLVLARRQGDPPFEAGLRTAARVFASAAAIVLALGRARQSLDVMRLSTEHERIARDLHDTVIQRLFGLGLRLQAAERMAEDELAERIRTAVDSIDEVIRDIRETIFDLNRPGGPPSALRDHVADLMAETAAILGFSPHVTFRGQVDGAVPDDLLGPVLAVLRECLANVTRHAGATTVDVTVTVADGWLALRVADDGIGIPDDPVAGDGLANMLGRAREMGGVCRVGRRNPSGTEVGWRVPLPVRNGRRSDL